MRQAWSLFVFVLAVAVSVSTPEPTHADPIPRWYYDQGLSPKKFAETQHTISGAFLDYWTRNGGLKQFGYPLTQEFDEIVRLNGNVYSVQYFERAIFEWHPENRGTEFEIILTQLGKYRWDRLYWNTGNPLPDQYAFTAENFPMKALGPGELSPTTHFWVAQPFLAYWEANGGLARQGWPQWVWFQEKSDLDGKTYVVQYFERALFEWHPENKGTPFEVLLAQLGKYELDRRYPNHDCGGCAPVP
jgi:hypothetical protein